jgi:hypothetical protein
LNNPGIAAASAIAPSRLESNDEKDSGRSWLIFEIGDTGTQEHSTLVSKRNLKKLI